MTEIAHEFFHAWNLVAIHPDHYGELSYRRVEPTSGLWMGEGVTLYYADALARRAGLRGNEPSRIDHLQRLLETYYAAWWSARVSPEAASLAFGHSLVDDPNASGGYYTQGELMGYALDAAIRDSTHGVRGMDDLMRSLFAQSGSGRGFTSSGLEATADSVCGCRLDSLFAREVRGTSLIDPRPALRRLGLELHVDTTEARDSLGHAAPDLRLYIDFTRSDPPVRLVLPDSSTVWARAGLRTGDELVAIDGQPVASYAALRQALQRLHLGDSAAVDLVRSARLMRITVPVTGYTRPRVRIIDAADVTTEQRARRKRWLSGW